MHCAKFSIWWSTHAPTLICGHELWVVTKRTRPQQQKMRLQWRWAELSLRHGLECRDIRWKLKVEPLLFGVKEPTEWFGHLIRMPLHSFLLEVFWVFQLGRSRHRTPRAGLGTSSGSSTREAIMHTCSYPA